MKIASVSISVSRRSKSLQLSSSNCPREYWCITSISPFANEDRIKGVVSKHSSRLSILRVNRVCNIICEAVSAISRQQKQFAATPSHLVCQIMISSPKLIPTNMTLEHTDIHSYCQQNQSSRCSQWVDETINFMKSYRN